MSPAMAAIRKHLPTRMTVDEFLVWDSADTAGRRWQLIDGEPVLMAPAAEPHGAIQNEFGALLRNHLLAAGSPCRVISAPGIVPRVRSNENFRVPDLGVTCAPPSNAVMIAEPIILIEILSSGNEAKTRANIWTYTTMPSVREILAIRSTRMEVEVLRRDAGGDWPASPVIVRPPEPLLLGSIDFHCQSPTCIELPACCTNSQPVPPILCEFAWFRRRRQAGSRGSGAPAWADGCDVLDALRPGRVMLANSVFRCRISNWTLAATRPIDMLSDGPMFGAGAVEEAS
jgi:Uma2 family endonuclease